MRKFILLLITTITFGQASNQMVTFTQAQSLGFALNAGQAHVTSNQCMTKAAILAKYNVTISGYASNQLVPRSVWVNAVTYYTYSIALGTTEGTSATCSSYNPANSVYSASSTIQSPMTFYANTALTIAYSGGGLNHFHASGNQLLTINNSGSLTAIAGCSVVDSTPPSIPANFQGTQTSANIASFTWSESTDNVGVIQYFLYQSTNGATGTYSYVTSSSSNNAAIGGLNPNTDYWFTVKAVDGNNNISGASNSVNIYVLH